MSILEQIAAGEAPNIVPITVDQYHRMLGTGILREGEPIELIDGILVRKDRADRGGDPMSHGPRHAAALKRLGRAFRSIEDLGYHLHSQLPVTLGAIQEPEPDLALVRGGPEDYLARHPQPADILAIMEVADSSLNYDRTTKLGLYARANIPTYWIVNLVDGRIEVHAYPQVAEGAYADTLEYRSGQTILFPVDASRRIDIAVDDVVL